LRAVRPRRHVRRLGRRRRRGDDRDVAPRTGRSPTGGPSGSERGVTGSVSLVRAGPSDPDLLTARAAQRLAAADVVVHDALVGAGVLDLVPEGVELIDVGKRPGRPVPQELINALLVD